MWINPCKERGAWRSEQEGEMTGLMLLVNNSVHRLEGGFQVRLGTGGQTWGWGSSWLGGSKDKEGEWKI